MFSIHMKMKSRPFQYFSNSLLTSVCEKLLSRDGLVWTVGLTELSKPKFSNSTDIVWTLP